MSRSSAAGPSVHSGTTRLPSFSFDGCTCVHPGTASQTFHRLVASLGLAVPEGVAPPRLHDLRHSFAVGCLLRWYRHGLDPTTRLHALSPFMGHADPAPTAVYLTITPRLLDEANPAVRGLRRAGVGGGGTMSEAPPLGPLLHSFFVDHLITLKGLRPASVRSYRDTVRLLLVFVAEDRRCTLTRLSLSDLTFDRVLGFLRYLEQDRGNHIRTRNQRLAALHALFEYIAGRAPEMLGVCQQVAAIPMKRVAPPETHFLERDEVEELLRRLPRESRLARRDRALLLFLYNTGARVQEAADLRVEHLDLGEHPLVRLHGKGDKWRRCPLWHQTAALLRLVLQALDPPPMPQTAVFSAHSHPLTRFGVRVVAGAQHRHEELRLTDYLALGIDDRERVAGEVEEAFLTRPVLLTHDEVEVPLEAPVVAAELAVLVAVGVGGLELQPEQLEGDALAPQLAVDGRPVGHRARRARWQRGRREEAPLQDGVVHVIGQRPGEAGPPDAGQVVGHRRVRHPERRADLTPAQALGEREAQDFADLAHGGSGARHRHLSSNVRSDRPRNDAVPWLPHAGRSDSLTAG